MSDAREKVAEAIRNARGWKPEHGFGYTEHLAEAAITAHLAALGQGGYVVVALPEPVVTESFGTECLQWLDGEVSFFPAEGRLELDYRSITPEVARNIAAALVAGAQAAEAAR
ncbi:hypothetical protein [Mycobacterium sp. 852013-50091_SCH5140682]|uniref:hypothetical protein n=1 Tax=Mycobacterium sp. 852013-50091_SCH5140682 TaxID=1834109 RepID=UPI000AD8670D|nr:hypothetical protein [Mycobacterium sp. 852013-50091_SCH5140682]